MKLKVDHVMFPVYNNPGFLDEVEEAWKRLGPGAFPRFSTPAYSNVCYNSKNFMAEHLSTPKGDGYWTNTVFFRVDKKHWDYYENPASRDEISIRPEFRGGYALFAPDAPFEDIHKRTDLAYDGLTLLISPALEEKLTKLCGLKCELPSCVAVDKKLVRVFEMVVINEKKQLIAPLFQCNYALDYWEDGYWPPR